MRFKFLLLILVASVFAPAVAQDEGILNKLLAPGPLVKGHADLEGSDCLKCHDAGKGVPDSQCLACHKEIRRFVDAKHGYHGLVSQSCRECHSDHKGRDYNSVSVDQKGFDHAKLTGYDLSGKHSKLKCAECHNVKHGSKSVMAGQIRYFGKQSSCTSCHKEDDVHFFKGEYAKKDCSSCHDPRSWKDFVKFDHERDAKYKLNGKHVQLKCAECHGPTQKIRNVRYQWPQLQKAQCLSCHQDFHKERLSPKYRGGKCTTCHSETTWKIEKFDHDITRYHLGGKHAQAKCVDCHKPKSTSQAAVALKNLNFTGLKTQCLTCHKDFHYFGNKPPKLARLNNCALCHNDNSWKDIHGFDHNINTRYKIDGKHLELKCNECHIPDKKRPIYKWPLLDTKTCENCHKSPHRNEFSAELLRKRCTECHLTTGWNNFKDGKGGVDHSKTRFPLVGAHTSVKCSDCHGIRPNQKFKFASFGQKFCIDCHSNIHKGQFSKKFESTNCTNCHSQTNFKERTPFDHDRTRYKLEGAHKQLKCAECHRVSGESVVLRPPNVSGHKFAAGVKFQMSQFLMPKVKQDECLSCHTDFHKGQLGRNCAECHSMDRWKNPRFDHNKQSSYILKGEHADVACAKCHKASNEEFVMFAGKRTAVTKYKPLDTECVSCHRDVHKGAFGRQCAECHTERDWKITRDFHKNFTLTGVHYSVQCAECHKDGRKLAGLSQACIACHAKDDVHSGTLPNCEECHRQQFWEVSSFRHSLTTFPLRGAHRTIDCMDCHRSGTYKGLSGECSTCHLQDAISATSLAHSPIGNFINCNNCHRNHFSWR